MRNYFIRTITIIAVNICRIAIVVGWLVCLFVGLAVLHILWSDSPLNWILIQDALIGDTHATLHHDQLKTRKLIQEKHHGIDRYSFTIDADSVPSICDTIQHWLSAHVGVPVHLDESLPIQYRQYRKGSFMSTHQDQLPSPSPSHTPTVQHRHSHQYEVVVTLFNDSDAYFYYFINGVPYFKTTNPGDVVVVKPGGVLHGVTKATTGTRAILKLAYHD